MLALNTSKVTPTFQSRHHRNEVDAEPTSGKVGFSVQFCTTLPLDIDYTAQPASPALSFRAKMNLSGEFHSVLEVKLWGSHDSKRAGTPCLKEKALPTSRSLYATIDSLYYLRHVSSSSLNFLLIFGSREKFFRSRQVLSQNEKEAHQTQRTTELDAKFLGIYFNNFFFKAIFLN